MPLKRIAFVGLLTVLLSFNAFASRCQTLDFPTNYIYLVDISGSMMDTFNGETRIDVVKKLLTSLCEKGCRPRDTVSLIAFSEGATTVLKAGNCQQLIKAAGKLDPQGLTSIRAGLEAAKQMIEDENLLYKHVVVVLLSDGWENTGKAEDIWKDGSLPKGYFVDPCGSQVPIVTIGIYDSKKAKDVRKDPKEEVTGGCELLQRIGVHHIDYAQPTDKLCELMTEAVWAYGDKFTDSIKGYIENFRATRSAEKVKLTWDDKVKNECGFEIRRDDVCLAQIGKNETEYVDKQVKCGETYTYTIRSYSRAGYGEFESVIVTMPSCPSDSQSPQPSQPPLPDQSRPDHPIYMLLVPSIEGAMVEEIGQIIAEAISELTGLYIVPSLQADHTAMIEAFAASEGDTFGIPTTDQYIRIYERTNGNVSPRLGSVRYGYPWYYSSVYARRDSGIKSIEDLQGKVWIYNDTGSTSGYVFPNMVFEREGIEFSSIVTSSGHTNSMVALIEGQGNFCTGYGSAPGAPDGWSGDRWEFGDDPELWLWDRWNNDLFRPEFRGTCYDLRRAVKKTYDFDTVVREIGVVMNIGPVPNDCLAFGPDFPVDIADKIVEAIKTHIATDEGKALWGDENFYEWTAVADIDDSFYDPYRVMLGLPIPERY